MIYFSLTVHFLTDNFKRKSYVLHAQPMSEERHTADHLSSVLEGMLENWGIKKEEVSLSAKNYLLVDVVENYVIDYQFQVHLVVRDNGRNITKALEDANFNGASCTAHNLNLVVQKKKQKQKNFSSY